MGLRITQQRGGERILVASTSPRFGQMIRDILGKDSLHAAARRTGLSANLISQLRNDHVPGSRVIAAFAEGYNLSEKRRLQLMEAAREIREDVNPELMLTMACELAGLDVEARLDLLDAFREAQYKKRSAAA